MQHNSIKLKPSGCGFEDEFIAAILTSYTVLVLSKEFVDIQAAT